jgi:hypothetical protein
MQEVLSIHESCIESQACLIHSPLVPVAFGTISVGPMVDVGGVG